MNCLLHLIQCVNVLLQCVNWALHVVFPVCAEAFNPDEDDDDTEPRVVHPKTDEQRCRLQEACRDILLFKTLEPVNKTYKREDTCTHTHTQSNALNYLCADDREQN